MEYMIDSSQIFLISAIAVSTTVLTIVGIQLIKVLIELRILLKKINSIVLELEKVGLNVGHGFGEVAGFITGMKNVFMFLDILKRKKKKNGKT